MGKTGPWKNGGKGAVSLCYSCLPPAALDTVLRHHAGVGIRATLVCDETNSETVTAADRNWDLAAASEDPGLLMELQLLDGRAERGCLLTGEPLSDPAGFLYRLSTQKGRVEAPTPDLSKPLPSRPAPADADETMVLIENVMKMGHWILLRLNAEGLAAMGAAGHVRLLRWLGEHHTRIWCATVRDIATWSPDPVK